MTVTLLFSSLSPESQMPTWLLSWLCIYLYIQTNFIHVLVCIIKVYSRREQSYIIVTSVMLPFSVIYTWVLVWVTVNNACSDLLMWCCHWMSMKHFSIWLAVLFPFPLISLSVCLWCCVPICVYIDIVEGIIFMHIENSCRHNTATKCGKC